MRFPKTIIRRHGRRGGVLYRPEDQATFPARNTARRAGAKGSGAYGRNLLPAANTAFNTFAGKVEIIPTVNFILKWVRGESGALQLDGKSVEISLITKDAFEPTLPLSASCISIIKRRR